MIHGIGNDIIEISRIAKAIDRHGKAFLDRLFTESEQQYCLSHKQSARHFAGRFAAKEAIAKALGTGISASLGWLDMEILKSDTGKPVLILSKEATLHFAQPEIQISISHCKEYATAMAIVFFPLQ